MSRVQAPTLGLLAADTEAVLRWMRSRHGPIYQAWASGSLTVAGDTSAARTSFRRILRLLDSSEADFRRIESYGGTPVLVEDAAMFRMYRRLRRAARRARAAVQSENGHIMARTRRVLSYATSTNDL